MIQTQVIEGTSEEIAAFFKQGPFAGQRLRVIVETEEEDEDLAAGLPDPPFTVRTREQLLELISDGLNSPTHEFTDDTLEQMRQEVRRRRAQQQP